MRTSMRHAATAAIVGLVLSVSVVGAPAALAQLPAAPGPVNAATITQDSGSITIHKRLNPENYGTEPTGTINDASTASGQPVEGIKFEIRKLTGLGNGKLVDVRSNEGYANAAEFAKEFANAADKNAFLDQHAEFDAGVEGVTNGDGQVQFGNLQLGVYLVSELPVEDKSGVKVNGEVVEGVITPSAPFLVFLPMTMPDNRDAWNYDVHAVPKNTSVGITKSVDDYKDDRALHAGDVLTYEIKTDIPRLEPGRKLQNYMIKDTLPKEVEFTNENKANAIVRIEDEQLQAGVDYVIEQPSPQVVPIFFTEAGLEKLSAHGGKKVTVQLPATILAPEVIEADPEDNPAELGNDGTDNNDGLAHNRAVLTFTNDSGVESSIESNVVKSRWGNLQVLKTGAKITDGKEGEPVALAGAKFELYRCDAAGTAIGEKLTVGNESEWTSNNEGLITIKGLQATDVQDGAMVDAANAQKYCLKETQAPEGYELSPQMHVVDFKEADIDNTDPVTLSGITVNNDRITQTTEVINLTKRSSFLPNTGGAGIGILMAVGALIIGAGVWAAKRMSRKA
ncbi:SpaH/EbpB family LPXTG-anchored major pilin [Corynebacterium freiburgense]|nr:SpaH/EbpB family LPXTG-anchored major pilin [Corynebacterium freiburgense]